MKPMILAAAAALIMTAGAAEAQDWPAAVRNLNNDTSNLRWGEVLLVHTGALSQGGELTNWVLPVDSWSPITAVARCDGTCTDVDLVIFDQDGQIVAQDIEPDVTPQVTFSPPSWGFYRVVTRMYACPSTCAVSTGLYQ